MGVAVTPGTSPGTWLLEVDTGGEVLRLASAPARVPRRAGGVAVYSVGLAADLSTALGGDAVSLAVRWWVGTPRDGRAVGPVSVRRLGPLFGRRAVLRYWRGEAYQEDAAVAVDGVVASASYGDPDEPDTVTLGIELASGARSSDVCDPQGTVNANSTVPTSGELCELAVGAVYPIVIGCPGAELSDDDTAPPRAAVPALRIDPGTVDSGVYLVAAGHVPAEQVEVWVVRGSASAHYAYPVHHTTDALGREISTIVILDEYPGTTVLPDETDEVATGWSRRTGWGGGVTDRGRRVVGLGDVLVWGSTRYAGGVRYDWASIESERDDLNRYLVDTCLNVLGVSWDEWVRTEIEPLFQIDRIVGPRGIYWRRIRWTVDPARVVATLVCDRSRAGLQVARRGAVEYQVEGEGPVSELSIAYGRTVGGGWARHRTVGVETGGYVYGQPDAYHTASRYCAAAAALLDAPRAVTIEAPHTWDPATASLLAQTHAERLCLPHRVTLAEGPEGLIDLPDYGTVRVVDERIELDDLAIVLPRPLVLPGRRVRRVLRIPPTV